MAANSGSLYSEKVMDHFRNPRNVGDFEKPDGVGHIGNPVCGDVMELYIMVKDDIITDARFKTFGCGAAIATSSMVTEMIKGKTVEELTATIYSDIWRYHQMIQELNETFLLEVT